MNFMIFLHRQNRSHSSGTGVIRIPEEKIALRLIDNSRTLTTLCGARLRMMRSKYSVDYHDIETLRQSPYQEPKILREQNKLDQRLAGPVSLTKLQFGWLDRDGVFSPEWSRSYRDSPPSACLEFNRERRELCIQETDAGLLRQYRPRRVVIRFGSVRTLSYSGNALLFTLLAPPAFEECRVASAMRTRHTCLHDVDGSHARVAPYTSSTILLSVAGENARSRTLSMCSAVHLPKPRRFSAPPEARDHFSAVALAEAERLLAALPWPVAFQVSSLMRNRILSAKELCLLKDEIEIITQHYRSAPTRAADIIIHFGEAVAKSERLHPSHNSQDRILRSLRECMQMACRVRQSSFRLREPSGDSFTCYHVAVTPTSELPQGPDPEMASLHRTTSYESDIRYPVQPCDTHIQK